MESVNPFYTDTGSLPVSPPATLTTKNTMSKCESTKFYKVLKDTPLWEAGAVIQFCPELGSKGGYVAVEEIFNKEFTGKEFLGRRIVENSPEWFQKVYKVNLLTKAVYRVREEAKELFNKEFTS